MDFKIAVLDGDGIGPEIYNAVSFSHLRAHENKASHV